MNFSEWFTLTEMGHWDGHGQLVPLPSPHGGTVNVPMLDMRFEDYGFPGSFYTNWYATLPWGGVISNFAPTIEHKYHPDQKSWEEYKKSLVLTGRQQPWKEVPQKPTPNRQAVETLGLDENPHPWWDYAEGIGENSVLKPGLYRKFTKVAV